jgi:ribonuclease T1
MPGGWHAGPVIVRAGRLARAAAAAVAVGSSLFEAVAVDAAVPPPTFDWPLDCRATVAQRYEEPELAVDVTYEVEAVEVDSVPGVIAIDFGPADVEAVAGDGETGVSEQQLAAYFTNPILEVESDGSPVEAVGFEEWLEGFEPADGATTDEAELEQDITHRAVEVTWESWVGLWSTLPAFDGEVLVETGDDGAATMLAERTVEDQVISFELVADPATLVPDEASYEARSLDGGDLAVYEWAFDWPACDGDRSTADITAGAEADRSVVVTPGFETTTLDELPPEALDTMALIESGGPFPYRQDGAVFENREGLLPDQPYGYYHEYTVETPGSDDRGARRLVAGEAGELFYTDDHYDSFEMVVT